MKRLVVVAFATFAVSAVANDPQRTLERGLNGCNTQYVFEALKLGANPNVMYKTRPALTQCINNLVIVRALIEAGADVNAVDTDHGSSPLMMAAFTAPTRVVDYLLAHGANVHQKNKHDQTALMFAADTSRGYNSLRTLLAAGADANATDALGQTALSRAASKGFAANTHVLLAAGADIHTRDERGQVPLWAAMGSLNAKYSTVQLLLEAGADVDANKPNALVSPPNPAGVMTPLMTAASRPDADLVELLLNYGANPRLQSIYGKTPLQIATQKNHYAVIKALTAPR